MNILNEKEIDLPRSKKFKSLSKVEVNSINNCDFCEVHNFSHWKSL
jgi:hypothetical protein